MPQEPKRRHSRQRKGKRRAAIHLSVPRVIQCKNCNEPVLPHTICPNCGFYKGRQIVAKKIEKTPTITTTTS